MSNFKFLKFAFFILAFVMTGYSVASAGFVTIYSDDDEDFNRNNNDMAAAIDALPAKTDGEIANCFDYYRFPSIQASFETVKEFYEPGQKVYFKGGLVNNNNYPIVDGYLFVRIARYNENYTQEGHDIVDEFFANSGPQGREKFYLEGGEEKETVFSWSAPENLAEGVYRVAFSFIVGKKMNMAGLSFTNEVVAGLTELEVKKSAIGDKRVFLEKSSFAVNGKKYKHIGLWPQIDKGAKAEVAGKLKNETSKKENVRLIYDLYYWDGLDDKNKVSIKSEDITVAPNSSHSFKYVIPKMDETVYFLRITAVAGNNQKSIVNLRFVSEQERPRINFFSPMKFPVLKGETMTNFACFHNTADKSANGKVTMNVFDEAGDKVQTLGYEGEITGNIMAVKKDAVALKDYDYLRMAASVVGSDGRADSYEMVYDCKNMNPENPECVKILEEKIKAIADASNKPFNKKGINLGIIALLTILAVAALLRKFFLNKKKSPLMFLLFAVIIGLTAFFADGAGNQALALSVTTATRDFNFPPEISQAQCAARKGALDRGGIPIGGFKFCVNGKIDVVHRVQRDNDNNTLRLGDTINFTYKPDEPFFYATGGTSDSPYGIWCNIMEGFSCLKKREEIFKTDESEIFRPAKKAKMSVRMTWLVNKPEVFMESSDSSVISCEDMKCTAKKSGAASLTANISGFTARPWVKVIHEKGNWESWEYTSENTPQLGKISENTVGFEDIRFVQRKLEWKNITVEPPEPTCDASFSPAEITSGDSTSFSWKTDYDEDEIISVSCDGDLGEYSGAGNGSWTNLKPGATQTCTATAQNSKGAKSCSAKVKVTNTPVFCSVKINKDPTGGNGSVNVVRSGGTEFMCNLQSGLNSCNSNNESLGDTLTLTPNPSGDATWPSGCSSESGESGEICTVNLPSSGACSKSVTVKFPVILDTPLIPDTPSNLSASAACKAVNLLWDNDSNGEYKSVTNSGSAVVNYYDLYRKDGSGSFSFIKKIDSNINRWDSTNNKFVDDNNSYTDSTATDSTKDYSYTIKACNDQSQCSADAGPATATPTAGPCGGNPSSNPSSTPSSSTPSSSSSADPGSVNLTVIQKGKGTGSVSLTHMGSSDGNDGGLDSNVGGSSPWGLAKNWKFQITATPDSGSSLGSVSGGGCGGSPCAITMDSDKTVTVTFNKDTSGCCGGGGVTAIISARENPVSDGGKTTIDWGSTNAASCSQSDGGDDSADWENAANTISGSYDTKVAFTTSEGTRRYTIECVNGSQTSGPVSVDVDVGSGGVTVSTASIWADKSPINYKTTTKIKWSSTGIVWGCLLYSPSDSLSGYLSGPYGNVLPWSNIFGAGYYKTGGVPDNNATNGQNTGMLTSDTVYKIRCTKRGFVYATDQTTVTVAKPVSNFTIANSENKSLVANIVEGLSANSGSIALTLSGEAIGNVSLSASIPAISGAKAQFSSDDGATWSDTLSVDISAVSQVKIKAIKIPGATAAGTYNTAVTAADTGSGGKTKKLNVNLRVNRVSSEWEEF